MTLGIVAAATAAINSQTGRHTGRLPDLFILFLGSPKQLDQLLKSNIVMFFVTHGILGTTLLYYDFRVEKQRNIVFYINALFGHPFVLGKESWHDPGNIPYRESALTNF